MFYTVTKIVKKFDSYGNEFETTKVVKKTNNESSAKSIYENIVSEVELEKKTREKADKPFKITSVVTCVYLDYSTKKMQKKNLSCTSRTFNTCYVE